LRCIRYHLKSFPRDILILNGGCEVACQRNDSEKSTIYHRIAEHTSLLSLTDGVQDEVMEILGKRNRYCVDWLGLSEQAKKQSRDATKVHALSGGEKTGRFWHVRSPPKIVCLHVNNTHFTHFSPRKMPPIRTRKSRARYFTPPPELTSYNGQIKTP
jgi:hypothetical protein